MISDDLRVIYNDFAKLAQENNIVEEIKSILGAHAEQSSPSYEFVFHRNNLQSLVISGIQAHSGELHITWSPMMDSLSLWSKVTASSQIICSSVFS